MPATYDTLHRMLRNAATEGKTPTRWRLSSNALRDVLGARRLTMPKGQVDGHPLSLLGLPYSVGPTASGQPIELISEVTS